MQRSPGPMSDRRSVAASPRQGPAPPAWRVRPSARAATTSASRDTARLAIDPERVFSAAIRAGTGVALAPRRPDSQQTTDSRGHVLDGDGTECGLSRPLLEDHGGPARCCWRPRPLPREARGAATGPAHGPRRYRRPPHRGRLAEPVRRADAREPALLSLDSAPARRSPARNRAAQSAFSTSCAPTAAKSSRMATSRTLVLQWLWGTSEDQRTRLFR